MRTAEAAGSAFLLRPPAALQEGGGSTAAAVEGDQALSLILKENPRVREAYEHFVPTGRMTKEKFRERLFQSNYLMEFLGLPDACSSASASGARGRNAAEDPGALLKLRRYESPMELTAQEVLRLAKPGEDLIRTEALRMRGFGVADGFNSFSGDLVDSSSSSSERRKRRRDETAGKQREEELLQQGDDEEEEEALSIPAGRQGLKSRLFERFNTHSHKLLLQQLLPPTAAAVVEQQVEQQQQQEKNSDEAAATAEQRRGRTGGAVERERRRTAERENKEDIQKNYVAESRRAAREQLLLLAAQEEYLLREERQAAAAAAEALSSHSSSSRHAFARALLFDASLSEKEAAALQELQLEDLRAPVPVQYQRLDVTRKQLYAAGSRDVFSSKNRISSEGASCFFPPAAAVSDEASEASSVTQQQPKEKQTEENKDATEEKRRAALRESRERVLQHYIRDTVHRIEGQKLHAEPQLYKTGRYMFVYSTKLCQSEKAAQVAAREVAMWATSLSTDTAGASSLAGVAVEYNSTTVNAVRAQQSRVVELLQHFYTSAIPEEDKRARIIHALDAVKYELEHTQETTFGPYTGAATKALCAPLFDQINAAKARHNKLKKLLVDLRAQRKTSHHMRQHRHTHAAAPAALRSGAAAAATHAVTEPVTVFVPAARTAES